MIALSVTAIGKSRADTNSPRWELKDLRKTCATYYDEHLPESSVEILDHSVRGITYQPVGHQSAVRR